MGYTSEDQGRSGRIRTGAGGGILRRPRRYRHADRRDHARLSRLPLPARAVARHASRTGKVAQGLFGAALAKGDNAEGIVSVLAHELDRHPGTWSRDPRLSFFEPQGVDPGAQRRDDGVWKSGRSNSALPASADASRKPADGNRRP